MPFASFVCNTYILILLKKMGEAQGKDPFLPIKHVTARYLIRLNIFIDFLCGLVSTVKSNWNSFKQMIFCFYWG